ncbi:hypothetical protein FIBSPDRAFT_885336 [Athelia psychrophila]|uniref:Uncharacterized protein n=1 Tax=Athelia psychrophila TaxID=1759441 RepID=A0A166S087_9AGAM|nr:hypothetical protein FIBSPDRAFT_885336 [Fibularhizoctonia sp. CBS 109695]
MQTYGHFSLGINPREKGRYERRELVRRFERPLSLHPTARPAGGQGRTRGIRHITAGREGHGGGRGVGRRVCGALSPSGLRKGKVCVADAPQSSKRQRAATGPIVIFYPPPQSCGEAWPSYRLNVQCHTQCGYRLQFAKVALADAQAAARDQAEVKGQPVRRRAVMYAVGVYLDQVRRELEGIANVRESGGSCELTYLGAVLARVLRALAAAARLRRVVGAPVPELVDIPQRAPPDGREPEEIPQPQPLPPQLQQKHLHVARRVHVAAHKQRFTKRWRLFSRHGAILVNSLNANSGSSFRCRLKAPTSIDGRFCLRVIVAVLTYTISWFYFICDQLYGNGRDGVERGTAAAELQEAALGARLALVALIVVRALPPQEPVPRAAQPSAVNPPCSAPLKGKSPDKKDAGYSRDYKGHLIVLPCVDRDLSETVQVEVARAPEEENGRVSVRPPPPLLRAWAGLRAVPIGGLGREQRQQERASRQLLHVRPDKRHHGLDSRALKVKGSASAILVGYVTPSHMYNGVRPTGSTRPRTIRGFCERSGQEEAKGRSFELGEELLGWLLLLVTGFSLLYARTTRSFRRKRGGGRRGEGLGRRDGRPGLPGRSCANSYRDRSSRTALGRSSTTCRPRPVRYYRGSSLSYQTVATRYRTYIGKPPGANIEPGCIYHGLRRVKNVSRRSPPLASVNEKQKDVTSVRYFVGVWAVCYLNSEICSRAGAEEGAKEGAAIQAHNGLHHVVYVGGVDRLGAWVSEVLYGRAKLGRCGFGVVSSCGVSAYITWSLFPLIGSYEGEFVAWADVDHRGVELLRREERATASALLALKNTLDAPGAPVLPVVARHPAAYASQRLNERVLAEGRGRVELHISPQQELAAHHWEAAEEHTERAQTEVKHLTRSSSPAVFGHVHEGGALLEAHDDVELQGAEKAKEARHVLADVLRGAA